MRRLFVGLANLSLGLSLFLLATALTLSATLLSPDFIKSSLKNSGFYDNIITSGFKLASIQPEVDSGSNFDSNIISQLSPQIKKVLTADFLQTNTEEAITGFADWLNAKTDSPQFTIDTASIKTALNTKLADYLQERLAKLPDCPINNDITSYDLMTTTCKPPLQLTKNDFILAANNFTGEIPLLDKGQFSFNDISDTTKNDAWQRVQSVYRVVHLLPYLTGVLAMIMIGLVILLVTDKAKAFRIIGHTFLVSGGLMLIAGGLTIFYLSREFISFNGGSVEQLDFARQVIYPLTSKLASGFGKVTLYIGFTYSIIGAVFYLIAHRFHQAQNRQTLGVEQANHTAADTTTQTVSSIDTTPTYEQNPPSPFK